MIPRRRAVLGIAATTLAVAAFITAAPRQWTATTTPSPLEATGSAQPTTPAGVSTPATPGTGQPEPSPAMPPAGVVRDVAPANHNEGLIALTARVCGSSRNWTAQAALNHIAGPEYVLLDSARLIIDCSLPASSTPPPAQATSTKPQAAVTVASATWVPPLTGRCDRTDDFGAPRYNPNTGVHYSHQGRDLPAPTGTPIHAITAGKVISAHDTGRGGLQVQIQSGSVVLKYNHLSRFAVHAGQQVGAGTVIGYVGSTGDATVPHLHLEVWVSGALRNPTTFLASHGIWLGC